jgi:hypothetical protein
MSASLSVLVFRFATQWELVETFRRNMRPPFSDLKMEAECSSETTVSPYNPTRRLNPKDEQPHIHLRENLNTQQVCYLFKITFILCSFNVLHPRVSSLVPSALGESCFSPTMSTQFLASARKRFLKRKYIYASFSSMLENENCKSITIYKHGCILGCSAV